MWKIYMQIEGGEDVKGNSNLSKPREATEDPKIESLPSKKKQKMEIEFQFSLLYRG